MTTKPIPEMTDQEIDNALAEMMGWDHSMGAYWELCGETDADELVYLERDWHPHDDLNQVWQCEEKLLEITTERIYEDAINFVLIVEFGYGKYSAIHAPARQRCIAMLMAIKDES